MSSSLAGDDYASSSKYAFSRVSLIDEIRFRRIAWAKSHLYQNSNVALAHIPRCAGTYSSNAIYGKPVGHLYARYIYDWVLGESFFQKIRVAFVRCPVQRLISAYSYAVNNGTASGSINPITRPPRWALSSFEIFCTQWLFHQRSRSIDYVFRPQAEWILDRKGEPLISNLVDISDVSIWLGRHNFKTVASPFNSSPKAIVKSTQKQLSSSLISGIKEYYLIDYKVLDGHALMHY
jgi:hypothetical protein